MLLHQQFENCIFALLQERILAQTEQKTKVFLHQKKGASKDKKKKDAP